jgi:lia operon protein LiaG
MKFNVKKFVMWLAIIMFASFATAGIILAITGNLSIAVEQIDESKTFNTDEISEIYIDMVSTDINIIPTDEDEIRVHFYGEVSTNRKREIPSLVAYRSGDGLHIEIIQPKTVFIGVIVWRTNLDVYIPEDSIEILKMETISADTNISDLKVDKFSFSAVSGDFKGESLFASDLRLNSISGDISLKEYKGDININNVSGDVVLEGGRQNDNIEVVTVSGDVYIEQKDPSNINIRTISGGVEINLSEDAQFYLKATTVSGDIETRFPIKVISSSRRDLEGIVGSDEKEIIVSTTSGHIDAGY